MIRMGKRGGAETMGRVLMHEEGIERRAEGEGKRLGPLESGGQRASFRVRGRSGEAQRS